MEWQTAKAEFSLPFTYRLTESKGNGLVIVMHGFQDRTQSVLKRLGWEDLDTLPFQTLAINGPFPMPLWKADGFKEAYAWYFRDSDRDFTVVAPQTTAVRLSELFDRLKLTSTSKVFLGFSQGGYLAPYVAAQTQNTKAIIGMSCGYSREAYCLLKPPLAVYGIHAVNDQVVSFERSKADHAAILASGFEGQFHSFEQVGHRVSSEFEPLIRRLIMESL